MNNTLLNIADLDQGRMFSVFVEQPNWDNDSVRIVVDKSSTMLISKEAAEELAYALLKAATSINVK
jgi:hypothetical protein